jgi:hypothetical protein
MTPDLLPGLLSVETRIRQLSRKLGRPLDCLEWPWPKELLEVEGDPKVQRRLVTGMRKRVQGYASKNRLA